ncbi:MAG: PrsW family intramembrane metalloprotease [Oscillochloris sp.]|nr:PrsW family intramembrane metalloprotease [Oscillochloris sp.]
MIAFLITLLLSFGPALLYAAIVYWLDRFEKEPIRLLVGAFLWGAFVATIGAIIASTVLQIGIEVLTQNATFAELSGPTLIAPLVEESLKGLAVGLIWLFFPHEFDSPLDGMVYAAITALGFAATENVLYLFFAGYVEDGYSGMAVLFVLRVILGGWGHAVYTAFIGIGFAMARLSRSSTVRILAPICGWMVAVFLHALHNTMAVLAGGAFGLAGLAMTLMVDWSGWVFAFGIVIWELRRERSWMRDYLAEEVANGTIRVDQYRAACSVRAQISARLKGKASRTFFELCAELAQKKHQLAVVGEERGNSARIQQIRADLAQLAVQI